MSFLALSRFLRVVKFAFSNFGLKNAVKTFTPRRRRRKTATAAAIELVHIDERMKTANEARRGVDVLLNGMRRSKCKYFFCFLLIFIVFASNRRCNVLDNDGENDARQPQWWRRQRR